MTTKVQRQQLIAKLIMKKPITSQPQLLDLLAHEGVIAVLVADMATIACSAGERHASSPEQPGADYDAAEAGRRYLEKLIQIQITLPPPRPQDLDALLRPALLGEQHDADDNHRDRDDAQNGELDTLHRGSQPHASTSAAADCRVVEAPVRNL